MLELLDTKDIKLKKQENDNLQKNIFTKVLTKREKIIKVLELLNHFCKGHNL